LEFSSPEAAAHYRGSVIDQLQLALDRSRYGPWAFYAALAAGLTLVLHSVHWLAGAFPFPTLRAPVVLVASLSAISMAAAHHADRIAVRALNRFNPALQASPAEYDRYLYRLTKLPPAAPLAAAIAGAGFVYALLGPDPTFLGMLVGVPLADRLVLALGWINTTLIMVNLFIMGRELTTVSEIHRTARNINLFDWRPIFAFSELTYTSSVLAVFLLSAFVVVFPSFTQNPLGVLFILVSLLLAGTLFVLPLAGLHSRLEDQQNSLISEARRRIQLTLEELHHRIEAADGPGIQRMKDQLTTLTLEEDYLQKLRTWPWPPGMFLRLLGVIGLPLLLFVLQRAIQAYTGL
jgi:hypothetical protein